MIEAGAQNPYAQMAIVIFFAYLALGLALAGFLVFKKKRAWEPPWKLKGLPDSAKAIVTLLLVAYALVFVFSLLEVYLKTRVSFNSAEEYFYYMSLSKLVATSHAHFFGHGTMYALTSIIFLLTTISEKWKVVFIVMALSAGLLDVPSWWMIKYAGGRFEAFSALAGMMSVIGWSFMAARILYELWFKKN